jgi:hypothetical protein
MVFIIVIIILYYIILLVYYTIIVACRPVAEQWLCKQRPLLGNGLKQEQRNGVLYALSTIITTGELLGEVFCVIKLPL